MFNIVFPFVAVMVAFVLCYLGGLSEGRRRLEQQTQDGMKACPTCKGTGQVHDRKAYMRDYMRRRRSESR